VDSYNSENGSYDPNNANANGNIGTNGNAYDIVDLSSNVTINGNVSTGHGSDDAHTVLYPNNSVITNLPITHSNTGTLPLKSVPSIWASCPNPSGSINLVNNGTATISTGDYKCSSINLTSHSSVKIQGDVRLYVTDTDASSIKFREYF